MKITRILLLVALSHFSAADSFAQTGWVQVTEPLDPLGNTPQWKKVVLSADGTTGLFYSTYQTNSFIDSFFCLSTNSGVTWTQISAPATFGNIVVSADASKLMIVSSTSYLSTNLGATWTTFTGYGGFIDLAYSADATKMAGMTMGTGGSLYVSTNSGVTWKASKALTGSLAWQSIAVSADGTKIFAIANDTSPGGVGTIYRSTNSGTAWTSASPFFQTGFNDVACSADGSKAIVVGNTSVYTTTNSGASWTWQRYAPYQGTAPYVTCSADGKRITVAAGTYPPGVIYISTDLGVTWSTNNFSKGWIAIATSADGGRLIGGVVGGASNGGWTFQTNLSPTMQAATISNNLKLSWIIPSTNFVLQSSADLSSWTNLTNQPVLNLTNLQDEVYLLPTNSNIFYRLKTP